MWRVIDSSLIYGKIGFKINLIRLKKEVVDAYRYSYRGRRLSGIERNH